MVLHFRIKINFLYKLSKPKLLDQPGCQLYRVIHKSLWNFQTRLRNNQERHGRKEHINR